MTPKDLHRRYPAFAVRDSADVEDNNAIDFRIDQPFDSRGEANPIFSSQHAREDAILERSPERFCEFMHFAQPFCIGNVVR